MASIFKRKNKWSAQWYVNGQIFRKSTGVDILPKDDSSTPAKNKKLAMQIAESFERNAKGNSAAEALAKALRAAADVVHQEEKLSVREYLENYRPSGQERNQAGVRRTIKRFLTFLTARKLDKIAISDLKTKTCEEFLGEMLQDVTEGSVSVARAYLSTCFNRAVHNEILQRNPFSTIRMKELVNLYSPDTKGIDKTERLPFTPEQMKTILFDFERPFRDWAAVSFFCGGVRANDAALLSWEQISFERNEITFLTQKTKKKLVQPLVPELRRRLEIIRKEQEDMGEVQRYVFPDLARNAEKGQGTNSTTFTQLLRLHGILSDSLQPTKKGNRKKVNPLSFHSIRHTCPSFMQEMGVPLAVSKDVVGHDSTAVHSAYTSTSRTARRNALLLLQETVMKKKD